MNHYKTLGVAKDADAAAIKKAYRSLASKNHPDKGGDTAKFQSIQAAYAALETPEKRAQYDAELAGGFCQFQFNTHNSGMGQNDNIDLNEILNGMLRGQFGFNGPTTPHQRANQQRQEPRNRDVRIAMQLNLVDTLEEQTKMININLPGNMKEDLEIKIPRGVHHGSTVRYAGIGDHSVPNAPRADLYIQFHVQPHPNFEQHGIDLVTPLIVNCMEAMVGCEKEVTGLDCKTFKISIPPGTQYGARFGIPEQGLYTTDHPGRGRLIVLLDIYIPKELKEEQIETIRSIQATLQ